MKRRCASSRSATRCSFIPFDDEDVIAGQGTIAYEICRDLPNVDMIVRSGRGGGLLAGISFYAKQINPRIKIVGVQAEARTPSCVPSAAESIVRRTP